MAGAIYVFTKTFEQRLEEFKDVLCSRDSPIPACDVADEWSYSLEAFIEPTGWQALWKISRQICDELNIVFPKYVFVKVLKVDFHELSAFVEVESVQDNICIPLHQDVPLIQLYPTKTQEDPILNMDFTANFIDQLRFFYNHLWCPWDLEDGEIGDWPSKLLEPRLRLFYDMNNGTIPVKLADKIHKKREQARKLYERKQELEMLSQKTTVAEHGLEDVLSPSVENQTFDLMQIHLQLNPLLMELQLLENPTMRNVVVKRFLDDESKMQSHSGAIVVWQGGLIDGFIDYLSACKAILDPSISTLSASTLESAIELAVSGSTILLNSGAHCINQSLEFSMSIIGVGSEISEVAGKESHSHIFNVRNAVVRLKNLKLDLSKVSSALQVLKNSTVELINCTITNGEAKDGRGIVVKQGGSVFVENCAFSGLHVAICSQSGSRVNIKSSKFVQCAYGVETFENSELLIDGSSFTNCEKAGIFVSHSGGYENGSISTLKKFPKFVVSDVSAKDNAVDVVLQPTA